MPAYLYKDNEGKLWIHKARVKITTHKESCTCNVPLLGPALVILGKSDRRGHRRTGTISCATRNTGKSAEGKWTPEKAGEAPGLYKYYSTQRPVDIGTFPKPPRNAPDEIVNYDRRIPWRAAHFWHGGI